MAAGDDPLDITALKEGAPDIRVIFCLDDWNDYLGELVEVCPTLASGERGVPPCPFIVAASYRDGSGWSFAFLRLGHLRDYFKSLLDFTSAGSTIKKIKARSEKKVLAQVPPPPTQEWDDEEGIDLKPRIRLELE